MVNTVTCHGCGANVQAHSQPGYPDNGWSMPIDFFGYYGGYTDVVFHPLDDNGDPISREANICHECVVRILEVAPGLRNFVARGGHPGNGLSGPPCCEHSWTARSNDDGSYTMFYGNHKGEWVEGETREGFRKSSE